MRRFDITRVMAAVMVVLTSDSMLSPILDAVLLNQYQPPGEAQGRGEGCVWRGGEVSVSR